MHIKHWRQKYVSHEKKLKIKVVGNWISYEKVRERMCSGQAPEARRKDEVLSPCETVKLRYWDGAEQFIEINEWTSSAMMK